MTRDNCSRLASSPSQPPNFQPTPSILHSRLLNSHRSSGVVKEMIREGGGDNLPQLILPPLRKLAEKWDRAHPPPPPTTLSSYKNLLFLYSFWIFVKFSNYKHRLWPQKLVKASLDQLRQGCSLHPIYRSQLKSYNLNRILLTSITNPGRKWKLLIVP